MKIPRTAFMVSIVAGLTLAACAPPPVSSTPPGQRATAPATPTALATIAPTAQPQAPATPAKGNPDTPVEALPENVVLVLRREGGFAGRRDLWTVYKTGRIETNKGETQQIGENAVSALLKDIDNLGFFELKDDYRNRSCADCFEYTLTAISGNKRKTVRTNDAGEMPATLQQIIDRVTNEVGNVK